MTQPNCITLATSNFNLCDIYIQQHSNCIRYYTILFYAMLDYTLLRLLPYRKLLLYYTILQYYTIPCYAMLLLYYIMSTSY